MAKIPAGTSEKVFQLKAFRGLNQCADGDTRLKLGEASEIRNWKITREGCLKRRPGSKTLWDLTLTDGDHPIVGFWNGWVNGEEVMVAACEGHLYRLSVDETGAAQEPQMIGTVSTSRGQVLLFGFSGKLYVIDGEHYKVWNGTTLSEVVGYVPVVANAVPPDGGGELLEQVNKLSPFRRVWLSPDGTGTKFQMPETDLTGITYVKDLKTGENVPAGSYTYNLTDGTVTFLSVPAKAVNGYEVCYEVGTTFRSELLAMKYSELYSGTQDTRVFLYGDGTNEALYSGITENGEPTAEYFPDQNEVAIGDANTPITAMVRHYSALICYKLDSAWSISFGITTLDNGSMIPAFYATPVNRGMGNEAPGQVELVNNDPFTLFGGDLYQWRNPSYYSNSLTADERQSGRVSDRIHTTLKDFDPAECVCFDDNIHQEYYIAHNGTMLVYNYAADAWTVYTGLDAVRFTLYQGELYLGGSDGKIRRLSEAYLDDDGEEIEAYWESGSIDFGQDYRRKNAAQLWIAMKPDDTAEPVAGTQSQVTVTVQTDRKAVFTEKIVNTAKLRNPGTREPYIARTKLRAKKFTTWKLILESEDGRNTPTVVGADVRVSFAGYAK